jgi:hypothetical protein
MRKSGFLLLLMAGGLLAAPASERDAATPDPVVAAGPARPASTPDPRRPISKRLWRISLASVAAANAFDIRSSWGKHELNATLAGGNGNFGARGVALKLSLQGGMVAVERLLLGRRPTGRAYRAAAIVNFMAASVIGGVAARNYGIPQPPGR